MTALAAVAPPDRGRRCRLFAIVARDLGQKIVAMARRLNEDECAAARPADEQAKADDAVQHDGDG